MFHIDWPTLLGRKGVSIKELSERTGISYRRLYHMIAEDADFVSRDVLGRVLRELGVRVQPPFYLLDEGERTDDLPDGENRTNDSRTKRPYRSYQRRPYRRRTQPGND